MDDFEKKTPRDEELEDSTIIGDRRRKKGRLVFYLPAFLIALITIALLVLMIVGTLFAGYQNGDDDTSVLHAIDFTLNDSSFDENYSYQAAASEIPVIINEQGLRWDALNSKIRINVPAYEHNLLLEITFGSFNAKSYDPIVEDHPKYVVNTYSVSDDLTSNLNVLEVDQGQKKSLSISENAIAYMLISFAQPITSVAGMTTMGFLYLREITLSQTRN